MKFGILGPLAVWQDDGREVPLGAAKPRSLLALLLLRREGPVRTETLVHELWEERPPPTAASALHTYVSQLRRVLGEDRIETRHGGYLLRVDSEELDAERFEQLLDRARTLRAEGETGEARHVLREALALWRGPPFADVRYERFAQDEIARLEELRARALEQRLDAELELGLHADAVPELEALVRMYSLRERLRELHMLALYRSGRQADALAAFRDARTRLRDELGLEPGESLRRLEAAILRQDPSLDAPPQAAPVAEQAPPRSEARPLRLRLVGAAAAVLAVAAVVAAVVDVVTRGSSTAGGSAIRPDSVGFLQPDSGRTAGQVALDAPPGGIAAGGGSVWVSNTDADSVTRLDPAKGVATGTIPVGDAPAGIAYGGGSIWVANGLDGTVSRIDPGTGRQVQTIAVGNGPDGVAYGVDAVWVANAVDGSVTRIEPASGAARSFPALVGASSLAVGFGRVWVVSPPEGAVVALDPHSGAVVDRVDVGIDPDAVAVGAGAVWVANRSDGTVTQIAPEPSAHVVGATPVGSSPVALAAVQKYVWVASAGSHALERIDVARNRVDRRIAVGNPPQGLALGRGSLYAAVREAATDLRGGTLRVAIDAPDSLDPARAYSTRAWSVLSMTEDTLVSYRRVAGIEGVELVPDLASALPLVSDGGRTYTFRLRRRLRYSNGRPVRPEDIRAEIERLFVAGSPAIPAGYYGGIVGVDRCRPGRRCDLSRGIDVDGAAGTITFHLTRPDGSFLNQLAMSFAAAVPAGTPARAVRAGRLPATGPYEVVSYRPGRSITLVRNPRFRQWSVDAQPAGYPDRIVFALRPLGHGGLVLARAVESGRADVAPDLTTPPLPRDELVNLLAREPSRLHLDATASTHFFFLNTRVPPFDDVRVRRAVNDAFDRQAFVRMLGPGYGATCHILPPNFPSYERGCAYADGGAAAVTRARAAVAAAGDTGKPVTVWTFHVFAQEGRFVASLLDELGFRARSKVLPQNPDAYFHRILDSRTHAQTGWWAWASDFPAETGFLPPMLRCAAFVPAQPQSTFDPSGFCDRRVDRLLAQASAAAAEDPVAAPTLWRKAEQLTLADAPFVPTANPQNVALVGRRVGNYEYNPQYGVLLDQLWVR